MHDNLPHAPLAGGVPDPAGAGHGCAAAGGVPDPAGAGHGCAFEALDQEIAAACRQIMAAGGALIDGGVRLGRALLLMAQTKSWQGRYPSFEAYCEQRHRLALRTAQRYMRAAASLPPDAALDGFAPWQVAYLAEVYRLDPDMARQWLAPAAGSPAHQWSRDEWDERLAALRAENERLQSELSEALARADQGAAMNRMLSERLHAVQRVIQETGAQSASARQEADRLRQRNQALDREVRDLRLALDHARRALTEPPARPAPDPPPALRAPDPSPALRAPDPSLQDVPADLLLLTIVLSGITALAGLTAADAWSETTRREMQAWASAHASGRRTMLSLAALALELEPTSDDHCLVAQAIRTLVERRL